MSSQSKGRPGGVLPINAAATKRTNATQKTTQRSSAPRLRLIIRRLPPGLTEAEFWETLGSEWQSGNGKVDWHTFKEGKISKDPAKPSRPGRAYLKVKDQLLLETLSGTLKTTSFKDAKNSGGDPCLVGPPSLEFAPYSKVPSSRPRHDGRQGTIDQDQEFIDFLQSLTEPITKSAVNGADTVDGKEDKILTTPLVQFIKEKKANKAKEKEAAAAAKSSKKSHESKDTKAKSEPRPTVVVKSNAAVTDKARVAKATQEAVKAANKSAAQLQNKSSSSKSDHKPVKEISSPAAPTPDPPSVPAAANVSTSKPERQRGSASAASRMIARDLGLAPKEPRAPRTARNAGTATRTAMDTPSKSETQPKTSQPVTAANSKSTTPATVTINPPAPPSGPKGNRSGSATQSKPAQPTQQSAQPIAQRAGKPSSQPSPGAKSAFLKHANPSQGVTEDLLRTTFTIFGEVTRCEIDKKKGLGYVDFSDTEALKKAMAVSPIKIGNGQVVVLENRTPYKRQGQSAATVQQTGTTASNSRAPSITSSAAVSAVTSPQPAPAVIATSEVATVVATSATPDLTLVADTVKSPSPQASTASAPTAPKGAKGGNAPARNARLGSNQAPSRGSLVQSPNRGRGGFRSRGGRASRAGGTATVGSTATGSTSAMTPAVAAGEQATAGDAPRSSSVAKG